MITPAFVKTVREILLWIGAALGVICLVLALACWLFGITPLIFRSGSMSPTYTTGELAFARTIPADDVKAGDVVSVTNADGNRVTHRVVTVANGPSGHAKLTLQGDANDTPDVELYDVTTVDRVLLGIPKAGSVVRWLSGSCGWVVGGALLTSALMSSWRGGPRPPRGRHLGPSRGPARGSAPSRRALRPASSVGAFGTVVVLTLVPGTLASWSDTASAATASIDSGSIAAPLNHGCSSDNPLLGTKSVTVTWDVPVPPTGYSLSYAAVVRGTSTVLTVSGSTSKSVTLTSALLTLTLGKTYHIDITASLAGTNWTRTSTQDVTVPLLGLALNCGSWTP